MSNKPIKFSIVFPIYNVEKYLQRCLDSVLGQTYKNYEVIMVDDGSTDNCPAICDNYAARDARIKVIHKQNAGLGMARNTGIENATGDYICFFDSDDFVATNLLELCAKELERENYDIVAFDYSDYKDGNVIDSPEREAKAVYRGEKVRTDFLKLMIYNAGNIERLHCCAWNKVYSMQLIRRIGFRFVSERVYISEDYFSNLILFSEVNSILVLPDKLYFYCYNGESLTHSYNPQRFDKIIYQYEQSLIKCDELGYSNDIKGAIAFQMLGNFIGAVRLLLNSDQDIKQKKQILKEVVSSAKYQKLFNDLDMKEESFSRKLLVWTLKNKKCVLIRLLFKLKYNNS